MIGFILTLIAAMAMTSIFFSLVSYFFNMTAFLLFVLPMMAIMIGGFKLYKFIRR